MSWGVGDPCELVNLRRGEVVPGVVEMVRGRRLVILTDDGKHFVVGDDRPFLHPPRDEDQAAAS